MARPVRRHDLGHVDPPTFAYWSVNTYLSSATVATNIATAVNANATVSAVITATANSPASGDVTFTAKTAGPGGDSTQLRKPIFQLSPGPGDLLRRRSPRCNRTCTPRCMWRVLPAPIAPISPFTRRARPARQTQQISLPTTTSTSGAGATASRGPTVYWAYNTGAYAVTTSPSFLWMGSRSLSLSRMARRPSLFSLSGRREQASRYADLR